MAYKLSKYEINRRKAERFRKTVHRKAVSDLKKIARQKETARNKRMRAYKREKEKRNSAKQKASNNANMSTKQEPMTFGDIMLAICALLLFGLFFVLWFKWGFWKAVWTTIILFFFVSQVLDDLTNKTFDLSGYLLTALFAITVILCFTMGFWKGLLIAVGVCVVALVLYIIFADNEEAEETENEDTITEEMAEDRSEQIPYLQSLLAEFDRHKEIINTSDDPDAVKRSLDCLLGIMDEIMTFDEMLLRKAGMTKSQMPEQKARVLELYDTMIEQAREEQKNKQS